MQSWQKTRNYRRYENVDGLLTFIVTVDGENVEVSEAIYKIYAQADRRERYCAERDIGRLLSLEQMGEGELLLSYLTDEQAESAEDTAIRAELMQQVWAALTALTLDEWYLVEAVVLDGVSEREYAASIGLSQKGVNKRKKRILEKLKKEVLNLGGYREG